MNSKLLSSIYLMLLIPLSNLNIKNDFKLSQKTMIDQDLETIYFGARKMEYIPFQRLFINCVLKWEFNLFSILKLMK